MSVIEIKDEREFKEEIKNGIVLVDFYADWCGPCKMTAPIIEEIGKTREEKIIKVNVDAYAEIAGKYGVMSIPTFIMFKNGKVLETKQGFQTKDMIVNWFKEL